MSSLEPDPNVGVAPDRMPATLMAHMVAFFPNRDASFAVAQGLVEGGARYLEVQFPFSDPSADGPLIQTAGGMALRAGFTVAAGFELVRDITSSTDVPVFIMSYGNLVFRKGSADFVAAARAAGAAGLIVPDLQPGADERLYAEGARQGVDIVPVVAPSISDRRLARIAEEHSRYLYAALRLGITGDHTEIGEANIAFLERLSDVGALVIAGFGINSPDQVRLLVPHVHALVVGSAFVKTILDDFDAGDTDRRASSLRDGLRGQVERLISGGSRP